MGTIGEPRTKRRVIFSALFFLWAMLMPGATTSDTRLQFSTGFVAAVGIVTDDENRPMLAEYDSDGRFVRDLGFLGRDWPADAVIYPAASWRAFQEFHERLYTENPEASKKWQFVSAENYEALRKSFKTVGRNPEDVETPGLLEGTRSVLLIGEDQMLNPNPPKSGFILAEYPIALHADPGLEADDVALILDKDGIVILKSKFDISYKVAVYNEKYSRRERDGTKLLWQPLPNVTVSTGTPDMPVYPGGLTTSDPEDGQYSMMYVFPPCPGFAIEHRVPLVATLDLQNFNPKSEDFGYITTMRNDYKWCVGYGDVPLGAPSSAINAQLNVRSIVANLATPIYDVNLIFSTMQLHAIGKLTNKTINDFAPIAGQTGGETPGLGPIVFAGSGPTIYAEDADPRIFEETDYVDQFDFNLDGVKDIVRINEANAKLVDVYISPNKPRNEANEKQPPDFTRSADYLLENQLRHQGLLSEISQSDLEDTDIYIYRRSTGQLLGSVEGLVKNEGGNSNEGEGPVGPVVPGSNPNGRLTYRGVHTDEEFATFGFTNLLVGGITGDTFSDLTSRFNEAKPARRRPWTTSEDKAANFGDDNKPDALRPGETVQVIAINRATGYIGTQDIVIEPSGTSVAPTDAIEIGPPNLKIIAKRKFSDFDELTKEERGQVNVIGSEGASLTSDDFVTIQTIWLDRNGDALPKDLPGYTGRLAISTGNSTKEYSPAGANTDFSGNFEIQPGYQTQVLQLNNSSDLVTEHFYVQVVGEPIDGNPSKKFESPSEASGRLQTRPGKYVPILVPLFDESSTRIAQEALAIARFEGIENLPLKPEPVYRWVYRPEMQFSVYELAQQRLRFEDIDGEQQIIDLTTDAQDIVDFLLSGEVDFVDLLYDVTEPKNDALDFFGPEGELTFAIGAEEVPVTVLSNGTVRFDQIKHLTQLGDDSLLSIRLFQNNDSANTLWEWSTFVLQAAVDLNRDGKLEFDYLDESGAPVLVNENKEPTDTTSTERRFRFWINNDLDVISLWGDETPITRCGPVMPDEDGIFRQRCENWDERVIDERHNTSFATIPSSEDKHIEVIDNYRDLEDFFPLKITISNHGQFTDEYRLEIKAHGISVNIFKGFWREDEDYVAHAYILDSAFTREQVIEGNRSDSYVGYFGKGDEPTVFNRDDITNFFGANGRGKFIMEGVEVSDSNCVAAVENCYLSFKVMRDDEFITERRIYMDLRNVRDFYQEVTAGSVIDNSPDSDAVIDAVYRNTGINETNQKVIDIFDKVFVNEDKKHFALFVHGWRMRETEKENFSDTVFKRLYWSGYRGTLATLKWPTGWFDKPAHLYDIFQVPSVLQDLQNYNNSEPVARLVGVDLTSWIAGVQGFEKKHVFAHSMGNVVVSEALRNYVGSGLLVESYSAMEAAEVAGSYNQAQGEYLHSLTPLRQPDCYFGDDAVNPEEAWRCYNSDNLFLQNFDMPPDKYRYDVPLQHGPTTTDLMEQQNNPIGARGGQHYFWKINTAATRIVSFYNSGDASLSGWELNQLTKPDSGQINPGSPQWYYDYEGVNCGLVCEEYELVEDRYFRIATTGTVLVRNDYEWSDAQTINEDTANIMGHILPARTQSLGQLDVVGGEIDSVQSLNFTNSNQDHSAQFHGYLSEIRPSGLPTRKLFWQNLLDQGFELEDEDYSGLRE